MNNYITKFPPLTPVVFHVLLALATSERHGYDIIKQIALDSNQKMIVGNGTLYGSIKRMLDDNLIEPAGEKMAENGLIRKYYKLTSHGKKILNAETERYLQLAFIIKERQNRFNHAS